MCITIITIILTSEGRTNGLILFLAGTSDARKLAIDLKNEGYELLVTVVTENASIALKEAGLHVRVGRLTADEMAVLCNEIGAKLIVDASHPFAEEASKNAITASKIVNIPYFRYERASIHHYDEKVTTVSSYEEAADVALNKKGTIMLTTGSKTLHIFAKKLIGIDGIRLIARMLPRKDNMEKCEQLGVEQKNIVAIQGPFSKQLNTALYRQYDVDVMVTKESGKVGSVDEKVEAALELGIDVIMIKRPKIDYGNVYDTFAPLIERVKHVMEEK